MSEDIKYKKTIWINDVTPVNATNLNNIEEGIEKVTNAFNDLNSSINTKDVIIDLK